MPAPTIALAAGGPAAVAAAWVLVRRRRVTVWTAMGSLMTVLGSLALATGEVDASDELGPLVAAGAGVAAGAALYLATAGFLAVARRWPPLARHAAALYDERQGVSLGAALAVASLLVAPGEELFWRGVVQGTLGSALDPAAGAALAWAVYVVANAVSGSIPIVLGAVVGGAAWAALALGTGGVAASIGCHVVWTGLMLVRPPIQGRW